MEISKENIFKTNYTSVLLKRNNERKKRTSFLAFIKKNKVITFTFIILLIGTFFNFILMYNFIKILETLK